MAIFMVALNMAETATLSRGIRNFDVEASIAVA